VEYCVVLLLVGEEQSKQLVAPCAGRRGRKEEMASAANSARLDRGLVAVAHASASALALERCGARCRWAGANAAELEWRHTG